MEWRELGWKEFRYVDPQGRICGGCEKGYRTWRAWLEGQLLGEYIDEDSAKNAVEGRLRQSLNPMRMA